MKDQYFEFNYQEVDWNRLIINSNEQNKIIKNEKGAFTASTVSGKSLLQICVENE